MNFSCTENVIVSWSWKIFLDIYRGLPSVALFFCSIFLSVCELAVADEQPAFPSAGIDAKYHPIMGSPPGRSFFLHYCLPDFEPRGIGKCGGLYKDNDPAAVNVEYLYALGGDLDDARPYLEGAPAYALPVETNTNIAGKTPYENLYKSMASAAKISSFKVVERRGESVYDGLNRYAVTGLSLEFWLPKETMIYRTPLGNPIVFVCGAYCYLARDLGNGWLVQAEFKETALADWQTLVVQFENSIREVME